LPENKDKRPDWWRPPAKRGNHNANRGRRNKKEKTEQSHKIELSKEAFARLVRDAKKGREKNGMEAVTSNDDMDSIRDTVQYYKNMRKSHSNNSNGSESPYSLFPFYVPKKNDEPPKGQKYTAEIIVEVCNKNGATVPIRALLDTGTSATIILEPFVREGTAHTNKSGAQQWETLGGTFATKSTANVRFNSQNWTTPKR
jgi:hypothetical protein